MDSDSDSTLDIDAAVVVVGVLLKRRKINKKRESRNKPWLRKPRELGVCDTLLLELRFREEQEYKNVPMMTSDNFDEILALIEFFFSLILLISHEIICSIDFLVFNWSIAFR